MSARRSTTCAPRLPRRLSPSAAPKAPIPSSGTSRPSRKRWTRCSACSRRSISGSKKKPIDEYKQEAFLLFERLLVAIREDVTSKLMKAQIHLEPPPLPELPDFITQHLDPFSADDDTADLDAAARGLMTNMPLLNIP